ncbi:tyrosine-protein phosphatase non-receptor type 22-like [Protopterus annectens]|uniref:tyrosine-protein phosphatase non-receptor type 22-like n=1 Tax=Protopterus annectens TaxID=7888 RepID=UPI001CFBDEC4|nr:tyrosine-protein phosphatase non-receptor type 22-like [Protopterus annectens]
MESYLNRPPTIVRCTAQKKSINQNSEESKEIKNSPVISFSPLKDKIVQNTSEIDNHPEKQITPFATSTELNTCNSIPYPSNRTDKTLPCEAIVKGRQTQRPMSSYHKPVCRTNCVDRLKQSNKASLARAKSNPCNLMKHERELNNHSPTCLETKSNTSYFKYDCKIKEPVVSGLERRNSEPYGEEKYVALWESQTKLIHGDGNNKVGVSPLPSCPLPEHLWVKFSEDPYFSSLSPVEDYPEVRNAPTINYPFGTGGHSIAEGEQTQESHVSSAQTQSFSNNQCVNFCSSEENTSLNNAEEDDAPPLPERTPESFLLASETDVQQPDSQNQLSSVTSKIGLSSEWCGTSHSNNFADSRKLKERSKSLKVRSTSRIERSDSPPPPPLPERTPESYILASDDSSQTGNAENRPTSQPVAGAAVSEKSSSKIFEPVKRMARSKSLKILKNVKKGPTTEETDSETTQGSHSSSFSFFGFGNRFSKPKGPRKPPVTWDV